MLNFKEILPDKQSLERIAALYCTCFNAPEKGENWTMESALTYFRERIAEGSIFAGVEDEGALSGICCGGPYERSFLARDLGRDYPGHFYISLVAVTEEARGRGLGVFMVNAFCAMAAAQGTMNNFTFGDDRRQYYETIAGGSGAGPDFDGTDVVQTHMTNSRLTDPEVLESSFPVLLEEFSIRRGSGGKGRHRGGDGAVRRFRFLEAMHAGILSNRRSTAPFGLTGGEDGASGVNRIERADGNLQKN